jgi:hypothetical protein
MDAMGYAGVTSGVSVVPSWKKCVVCGSPACAMRKPCPSAGPALPQNGSSFSPKDIW